MQRQKIVHLVCRDTRPLTVQFVGLDLSAYTSVKANVQRDDGLRFTRAVTPDPVSVDIGTVAWSADDLVQGQHHLEFEFFEDSIKFTLPMQYPVILSVRGDLG